MKSDIDINDISRVVIFSFIIALIFSIKVNALCEDVYCIEVSCDDIDRYIDIAIDSISGKSDYLTKDLVMGVIKKESSFYHCDDHKIKRSRAGAVGLMQLTSIAIKDIKRMYGIDIDPCYADENVLGGVLYLNALLTRYHYEKYETPIEFTLAAYNCGPGCVDIRIKKYCLNRGIQKSECGYGDEVPEESFPSETRDYVAKITHWIETKDIECRTVRPPIVTYTIPPTRKPCECECNGMILHVAAQEGNCKRVCERACGANTNCPTKENPECEDCCNNWCSGFGLDCIDACTERCNAVSSIKEVIDSIKLIVIIVAAIIFAICGIEYLVGDPALRNKSKRCIIYVVIGLIIVGIALELVNLIYKPITPKQKCEDIGGVCLSVPCEEKGCSDLNGICEDEEKPHCCKCDGGGETEISAIIEFIRPS